MVGHFNSRPAAALIIDGRLDDLFLSPPETTPLPGAIYRARAERPLKGLGGIFVAWPGGRGFLRDARGVSAGETLLVQVTGYAERHKAAPVTRRLLFKSRYVIVTPGAPGVKVSKSIKDEARRDALRLIAEGICLPSGMGAILRSSTADANGDDIAQDLRVVSQIAARVLADKDTAPELLLDGYDPAQLAWMTWGADEDLVEGETAFEDLGVLDQIELLDTTPEALPQGASMVVEPTSALIAVDVNTGPDGSPAAGLKASIAATKALPRALRLRGLGGQITIDFPPFPKKERRQLETVLRAAFRSDPVETTLAGWTPLGHFELQRKRERCSLAEAIT